MSAVKEQPAVYAAEPEEDALRTAAVKRLKKKRDFKGHLFVYLVVNAALWTIWIVIGALNGFTWPWPAIVTFFWGLFVLGDARDTYWKSPVTEAEIQREISRMKGSVP